jgi:hypothetical protein
VFSDGKAVVLGDPCVPGGVEIVFNHGVSVVWLTMLPHGSSDPVQHVVEITK